MSINKFSRLGNKHRLFMENLKDYDGYDLIIKEQMNSFMHHPKSLIIELIKKPLCNKLTFYS
ncbi:hypothetical protein [Labilibaculum sp.]|uniref:hypothetical protein n=1 Tax=Labilibaculum sp. TaxID=2060723 RepID=UPI0035652E1E